MIGRLRGILIEKQPPLVVLDVQGVGYEVEAPINTILALPPLGETAVLFTHMVVREDAQLLYGFSNDTERRLFRELIKISGVGPRMALAILSGMDRAQLVRCLLDSDTKALTQLPGVGKKTAERLIIEMRDRLEKWPELKMGVPQGGDMLSALEVADQPVNPINDHYADAEAALIALGYKPTEAARMLSGLDVADSAEALIKQALTRKLAGGSSRGARS